MISEKDAPGTSVKPKVSDAIDLSGSDNEDLSDDEEFEMDDPSSDETINEVLDDDEVFEDDEELDEVK